MRLLPALRLRLTLPHVEIERGRRFAAHVGWCALGGLLFVATFNLPSYVAAENPDEGWSQTLGFLARNGGRLGVDVVFPYGPLAPLVLSHYDAEQFWTKYTLECAGKLAASLLLLRLARRFGPAVGSIWLAGLALLNMILPMPVELFLLAGTASVIVPVLNDCIRFVDIITASIFLAAVSLTKFTLCPFSLAVLSVMTLVLFTRQSRWRTLLPLLSYAFFLSLFFTLASQRMGDLPAFLKAGFAYSAVYADGLAIEGPAIEVRIALAIMALLLLATGSSLVDKTRWPATVTVVLISGVAWKAGFVRHDSHALGFFGVMLFTPAMVALLAQRASSNSSWLITMATFLAGLGFMEVLIREKLAAPLLATPIMERLRQRADQLLRPGEMQAQLERQRVTLKRRFDLPRIRAAVGSATVDAFTECQGVALLNDLRLKPRPTLQSVNAIHPDWLLANADRLRGHDAPHYALVKWTSFDGRYPTMTDGPALLAMLAHYELLLEENGYLLLSRRPNPRQWVGDTALQRTAGINEVIELPELQTGEYRTLTLHVRKSSAGIVRSAAYRPAILFFLVRDQAGKWHPYRLVAPMAQVEFLLDPLCDTPAEFHTLFAKREGRRVTAIRLHVSNGEAGYVADEYSLELKRYHTPSP